MAKKKNKTKKKKKTKQNKKTKKRRAMKAYDDDFYDDIDDRRKTGKYKR